MAVDCTPQAVASDARCFTCVPEKALLAMQVYLLQAIANNAMTVQELMDASACFRDCMTGKALYGAMVYLLCQINDSGGGGGGGGGGGATPGVLWIYWEAAHADNNPPADPTKAYMRRFLDGSPPVIWEPDLAQWL